MNCSGKNAIITGGTGGIGMAIAREMLNNGAKAIGILDVVDNELIQTLKNDFPDQEIVFLKTDVRKRNQLKLAFDAFISKFEYVDIVVSAAGIINENAHEDCVLINLLGVINTTYEAIDHMSVNRSGRGGVIANISSVAGIAYSKHIPVYTGTKFGIVGFSKSIADEAKKNGINISIICPGGTNTSLLRNVNDSGKRQSTDELAKCLIEVLAIDKEAAIWTITEGKFEEFIPKTFT